MDIEVSLKEVVDRFDTLFATFEEQLDDLENLHHKALQAREKELAFSCSVNIRRIHNLIWSLNSTHREYMSITEEMDEFLEVFGY